MAENGLHRSRRRVLERLIALEPDSRDHWEGWLVALAASGSEQQAQRAIRRLLAGVDEIPITDETADTLRRHLIDSAWRSLAMRLAANDETDLRRGLEDLDILERQVQADPDGLWVLAARCLILSRLHDEAARDDAIGELERRVRSTLAVKHQRDPETIDLANVTIRFPDGLVIGAGDLRRVLTNGVKLDDADLIDPQGPVGDLDIAWQRSLEADIVGVAHGGSGVVVAVDQNGTMQAFASASGKLLWQRKNEAHTIRTAHVQVPTGTHSYRSIDGIVRSPKPVGNGDGRVALITRSGDQLALSAYAAETGLVLWRSPLPTTYDGDLAPPVTVIGHGDAIITFDGKNMRAQARDMATGQSSVGSDNWLS